MLIQDEVVEELEKKGQKMEFDKEVVAQVAFAICDTLCATWPSELLQYAKHAKRSVVNISDLTLLFRRNENMLSLIENIVESSLVPARKRQTRKGASKKNTEAANSIGKMNSENSKDVVTLLSGNNGTLKLADFWNQPSTSRERSVLLPVSETSATTEENFLSNSIPLQRKEIATKRRGTPLCCKQKTDIITESKTNNRKEKQSQATKQWLQPAFHIDGSKSREKQELESLNINIPCYSGEKYLRKRKLQSVSDSLSIANQEMNGINELDTSMCAKDLSKEVKMNAENAAVSALELHDEIPIKSFTAVVASNETALHILANKTDGSKTEFHKPIFCAETPVVNSMRKISGGQLMDTSLRNRSSAADDCFSSFKFESDDEDLDQSRSLVENKVEKDKSALSSSISSNRSFAGKCTSMNNDQEEHQNSSSEESDIDLDATVFDF